jgi:hypothetical protein
LYGKDGVFENGLITGYGKLVCRIRTNQEVRELSEATDLSANILWLENVIRMIQTLEFMNIFGSKPGGKTQARR